MLCLTQPSDIRCWHGMQVPIFIWSDFSEWVLVRYNPRAFPGYQSACERTLWQHEQIEQLHEMPGAKVQKEMVANGSFFSLLKLHEFLTV
jgi:hypothetical protein